MLMQEDSYLNHEAILEAELVIFPSAEELTIKFTESDLLKTPEYDELHGKVITRFAGLALDKENIVLGLFLAIHDTVAELVATRRLMPGNGETILKLEMESRLRELLAVAISDETSFNLVNGHLTEVFKKAYPGWFRDEGEE